MIKIIPTIFVNNKKDLEKQFSSLKNENELFQIDITDGKFVNNQNNIDPLFFVSEKNKLELHLMVVDPMKYFQKWSVVPNVKRVLVHIEILENVSFEELKKYCKIQKWELALVINPNTDLKKIDKYINKIKSLMFMGVVPGAQGQKFNKKVLEKIKTFSLKNPQISLALDGGVNETNIKEIIKAGIENICIGSAIFKSTDVKKSFQTFKQLTKK